MSQRMPYDEGVLLIVLVLVGFGLIMVGSASGHISQELYGSNTDIFVRQLIAVVIGLVLLRLGMTTDYRRYEHAAVMISLFVGAVLLLIIPLVRPGDAGVRRWISLGPLNFQPSELAKLVVVLCSAYYLVRYRESIPSIKGLIPYLGLVALPLVLILMGRDLGTAAAIAFTACLLLYLGGGPLKYLLGLLLASIPIFYFLVFDVEYRRNRLLAFWNPSADPYGIGYQVRQSLIAVGSGGWTGQGFANGKQKLSFLPESHTDFIFAVVGEELGLLGCVFLLVLFALLFWRGVRIALRADTSFGSYLALGIVSMIVLQGLINMSVVVSLVPTKGIPLPFISVGGSSMLVMMAGVGILLNISRRCRQG